MAKLTAFDGGGFLLRDLTWLGPPPKTIKQALKLLGTVPLASSGDVKMYERPEPAPCRS